MWVGFEEYVERLATLHAGVEKTLEGLPPEALDWTPGPDMNSLAVLAVHTAGSERFWIGDIAAQEPSGRDRDAEFRTEGLDGRALIGRLRGVLAYSRAAVEKLDVAGLEAVRAVPDGDRSVTVAWCLAHALEHTALHLGHMEITRQLWEQQAGRPKERGGR